MPTKTSVRKVRGGKLFRLTVATSTEGASVRLDGDLFIHPEEGLEDLERWLAQCLEEEDESSALRSLQSKLEEGKIQIIGASAADMISALWEARP